MLALSAFFISFYLREYILRMKSIEFGCSSQFTEPQISNISQNILALISSHFHSHYPHRETRNVKELHITLSFTFKAENVRAYLCYY